MKMVKQSGSVESGEVLVRELDFLVRMWIWDVSDFFFVDLVIEWDHLVDLLQKKKKRRPTTLVWLFASNWSSPLFHRGQAFLLFLLSLGWESDKHMCKAEIHLTHL